MAPSLSARPAMQKATTKVAARALLGVRMSISAFRARHRGAETLDGGGVLLVACAHHGHERRVAAALAEGAAQFYGQQRAAATLAERSHVGLGAIPGCRCNLRQQEEVGLD